jgi:hypothetical protein
MKRKIYLRSQNKWWNWYETRGQNPCGIAINKNRGEVQCSIFCQSEKQCNIDREYGRREKPSQECLDIFETVICLDAL